MSEKVELGVALRALDNKDRKFYRNLSDEQKKSIALYPLLRYSSSVSAFGELEHYYLAATNAHANKHFFEFNKHPEFQWLLLTTASPSMGQQRHQWISAKKSEKKATKGVFSKRAKLLEFFPNMKISDIDVLEKLISDQEIKDYIESHGDNT